MCWIVAVMASSLNSLLDVGDMEPFNHFTSICSFYNFLMYSTLLCGVAFEWLFYMNGWKICPSCLSMHAIEYSFVKNMHVICNMQFQQLLYWLELHRSLSNQNYFNFCISVFKTKFSLCHPETFPLFLIYHNHPYTGANLTVPSQILVAWGNWLTISFEHCFFV